MDRPHLHGRANYSYINAVFVDVSTYMYIGNKVCMYSGADPGGGARVPWPPPPHFLGKNKGAQKTTHTEKKRSKSDNHEARYRLKRTPKTR